MTPFQKHKQKWSKCTDCELHKGRKRVVLAGGILPAPILFIGEGPGASEDVIGRPFCGPAGKMLHHIIERSLDAQYDYALTNLVACIPKDEHGTKTHEPSLNQIKACSDRLVEIVQLAQPRLIVLLGKLAKKHVGGQAQFSSEKDHGLPWLPEGRYLEFVELIHPAAILRLDVSQSSLAIQRCIVTLSDALEFLEN